MITYVTLGTNNLKESSKFYDEILSVINAKRIMESKSMVTWGISSDAPLLAIMQPFNGEPASVGNGSMIAIASGCADNARKIYETAMALGAKDEGAPGPRGDGGNFAAYFRDLDGNKINACARI